jgi:hypothetical protein
MIKTMDIERTSSSFKLGAFQKILLMLSLASMIVVLSFQWYVSPRTFTIDAQHWECTATEPHGIEARCTNFTMKKFGLRTE